MINQILKVIPHGLIESGTVNIKADQDTGLIDYSESIIVGVSVFDKTIAQENELKISPDLLLSKSIQPGMKMQIGQVEIEVVNFGLANITYQNGADTLSGTAILDLDGQYLQVTHVDLKGTIQGAEVEVELQS